MDDYDPNQAPQRMQRLMHKLYPLNRSLTGQGVRQTLSVIKDQLPLEIVEVSSGTPLYDWEVPLEWNFKQAFIEDSTGKRIIDAADHNLHLVGYSAPVDQAMSLAELKPHLHSLPEHPEWIPYRTSYYKRDWGFCLRHRQLLELAEGMYRVRIDSTLEHGSMTYGQCVLPGEEGKEVLISCHICHPSLANDNLSGMVVAVELGRFLQTITRRYTWRILFVPATLGALAWMKAHEATLQRVSYGLVLACVGDEGPSTYKRSRRGNADIDRIMEQVLCESKQPYAIQDFSPLGYDQRQYCSPGFDLPVGSLMRTPNGCFAAYHTSADDLDFVKAWALADSLNKCIAAAQMIESNRTYLNICPKGEVRLGKRGLYEPGPTMDAMLWVLNLSDGKHDLLAIARRANMEYGLIALAAQRLVENELLREHLGQ